MGTAIFGQTGESFGVPTMGTTVVPDSNTPEQRQIDLQKQIADQQAQANAQKMQLAAGLFGGSGFGGLGGGGGLPGAPQVQQQGGALPPNPMGNSGKRQAPSLLGGGLQGVSGQQPTYGPFKY
jgi:hypothetical protein